MKRSIKTLVSIFLTSVLLFPGCYQGGDEKLQATNDLFVAVSNAKIERFDSVELELGEGVKDVVWSSSDKSVAVVENGELIGLKTGTTTISAQSGNLKQEQKISVVDNGSEPTINVDYLSVLCGDTYALKPKAYFKGKELQDVSFVYETENSAIANVADGVLYGVSYGETTATISMSWRGQRSVAVKQVPCSVTRNVAVYTDKAEYVMYTMDSVMGVSFPTSASVQVMAYYESKKLENLVLDWTSADESVATVDDQGNLTAVGFGETYVVAKCAYNDEELSTRKIPVKVEKPYLVTDLDFAFESGDVSADIDEAKALGVGYSVGKIVDLQTGAEYQCENGVLDFSTISAGEYTFAVYEENMAFATQINGYVGDYMVTNTAELKEAVYAKTGYIVLANDIEFAEGEAFITKRERNGVAFSGTFNGLGHKISNIVYGVKREALFSSLSNTTIKNLSISCILKATDVGGLTYSVGGTMKVDNCYIEATIPLGFTGTTVGGIWSYTPNSTKMTVSNTFVRVHNLNQSADVMKNNGAAIGRCKVRDITFQNSYVIAEGNLCSLTGSENSTSAEINALSNVLYANEAKFTEGKKSGAVNLNGFNRYWDLTGTLPTFR